MDPHAGVKTALVVDDDAGVCALLQEILQDEGFVVACVQTGQAALQRLAGPPPTVVLLDLMLPDLPGETVLAALRARWGATLPVIVSSAADARLALVTSTGTAATTHLLAKPFELEALLTLLSALAVPA
jgi:DNA-binding response OmpR family regulator